jgi:hypothetical protein
VLAVDHRFALSKPALVSAPSKKSFSSVNSPILACSDFTSIAGAAGAMLPEPKTPEAPPSNWAGRNLIGMDIEVLGQLSYRPVTLDGGKRHLRLEARRVVPAQSSVHGLS